MGLGLGDGLVEDVGEGGPDVGGAGGVDADFLDFFGDGGDGGGVAGGLGEVVCWGGAAAAEGEPEGDEEEEEDEGGADADADDDPHVEAEDHRPLRELVVQERRAVVRRHSSTPSPSARNLSADIKTRAL